MDTPLYQTVKQIYLEARARHGDERRAFLERVCADQLLRQEVESLLSQEEILGGFLERPATEGLGKEPEVPASHPERIGAYRIVRALGFGGMGVVYLAQQDSPRRPVALKLLRFDTASPSQLARFEGEAEILGRLSHAGIARVYEAGWAETETGRRPFFAMEFVEGQALHEYVIEHRLDLAEKLRLLCQVAEAVHYAHERGVVHRDLKPSNVLIDERGEPRVLDFGVARLQDSDSRATKTGQLVGTLSYMSPEQAVSVGGVDARSDVYSLGVILYELLTGRLPVVTEGLPLHEAVRRVREEEPIAAGSVRRELRGDLETVLGKALAKEPARRYVSAAEFAEDLRLFLDHRPIRARRPTSLYVGWKLVRRHRVLAATVVALFLALSAAQYVSLVLVERSREMRRSEKASQFRKEVVERQRLRDDIWRKKDEGKRLLEQGASAAGLEKWLATIEPLIARLPEELVVLAEARTWLLMQPEDSIATPDEKEYAFEMQEDLVNLLEEMSGPRGTLALVRNKLEQMRVHGSEAGVAEQR